ncbi:hypothetical protein RJ639_034248 [Escallonia herrerae]|uniref:Scarecrow-like protein 15 n=1 Tax=Escallonia herrerae TaxID=1293975 RepID=A0AA88X839_9ASTE|nr:hypothetical protein RJ639_034248 [Escallonia herrerae]
MKVPFITPQNQHTLDPKQANSNASAAQTTYEPKSVLDVRHSPSPTATKPPGVSDILYSDDVVNLPLEEDHGMSHLEDWDSLMRELGLHDDSTHASKLIPQFSHSEPEYNLLPEFQPPHSFGLATQFVPPDFAHFDHSEINSWDNVGLEFVDELIRLAECVETNSLQLGDAILARLNQKLRSPVGKPLQRAAYYFKEALQSLLTGSNQLTGPSTPEEVIQTIKAYRTFSNVSPIPMFSNFTATQAMLEAVDGSRLVHVIDFDIGLGGHWASFMKEIAEKAESRKSSAPVLRLTAVVPEEYEAELRLIRDNLCQFARELEIGFEIDFVSIRTFEFLSFKAIKFIDGEKTAVILSPTVFRRVGSRFLNDLQRIAPHVVVHVDGEELMGSGTASLRQFCVKESVFQGTSGKQHFFGYGGKSYIFETF